MYLHTVFLDSCGADTQGAIGSMIQQRPENDLHRSNIDAYPVTVVTQVVVDENDPAFQNPTKSIGPFLDGHQAQRYEGERVWSAMEDAGRGWRRVVPSPVPLESVERDAIRRLVDDGYVVIGAGGGGIPVVRGTDGSLKGVETVIDKDLASAVVASSIGATSSSYRRLWRKWLRTTASPTTGCSTG